MSPRSLGNVARGLLAAVTFALVVGVTSAPAFADPGKPTSASDAMNQYQKLSAQAEKLNQQYLQAKSDLGKKQDELAKANAALDKAKQAQHDAEAQEEKVRGQVDQLSSASYEGARFSQLSAFLTGTSPQDFLDRASAMHVLANENYAALHKLAAATKNAADAKKKAADAQHAAQGAKDAAAQLVTDISNRKKALDSQISQVKDAVNRLTAEQQASLKNPGDTGVFIGPAGAAGAALQAALSQRGTPYVWGGTSPGGFDCSGLTQWAYAQAGIHIPRTSQAQQNIGKPVSRSNLRPGDLVFFGNPAYHVAMYVGNGKMVEAPTSGEVVRVSPVRWGSYSGARRVVG